MSSIRVEESYIKSSRVESKILKSFIYWGYSFLYLLFFIGHFTVGVFLVVYLLVSIIGNVFILFETKLLKHLCSKWTFKGFLKLQRIANMVYLLIAVVYIILSSITILQDLIKIEILSLSAGFAFLLVAFCMLFAGYTSIFTIKGGAILYLQQFINDFQNIKERTDFKLLLLASKRISKWVKRFNMYISPFPLALGMSLIALESENDSHLNNIIEGLNNPFESKSFNKLRSSIEECNSAAKVAKERGILERPHVGLETVLRWLEIVIIPLILALTIHVIPKLIEMYS